MDPTLELPICIGMLQDISHHRRFAPKDVSHPSSRRFDPVAVTICPSLRRFAPVRRFAPTEDVSPPYVRRFAPYVRRFRPLWRRFAPIETFRPLGKTCCPLGKTFRPLFKLRHFEPLCETFCPHSYRTFRPRSHGTFRTLRPREDVSPPFL